MSVFKAVSLDKNGLDFAKSQLAGAERNHKILTMALRDKVTANDPILLEINTIISNARDFVAKIPTRITLREAAENSALIAKHAAIVKTIETRFKDLGTTSDLHRTQVGRIMWSRSKQALASGDVNQLANRFALSDPIYGSAFASASTRPYCRSFIRSHSERKSIKPLTSYRLTLINGSTSTIMNAPIREKCVAAEHRLKP